MYIREGPSSFTFFCQDDNTLLGIEESQEIQPFVSYTHTRKICTPHTDCKCNVSVWESEPVFLDPKAITGPASSPPWPPAPHGQRFSQVAHVWQEPFMNTAVAPTLQGAPGSPRFWELESKRSSGFIPHRGWLSSSCCLGADILEIPTDLVFRLHRSCKSHLA